LVITINNFNMLKQTLKLINTCYTINKNVKQKAYTVVEYNHCQRCGRSKEGYYNYYIGGCDMHDWKDCYFEHTSVDKKLRDSEYKEKSKLIFKIIKNIKKYQLPIKYGKNDDVIYFQFNDIQCSFHDKSNQFANCKKFKGSWTGVPNKKIPFSFVDSLK